MSQQVPSNLLTSLHAWRKTFWSTAHKVTHWSITFNDILQNNFKEGTSCNGWTINSLRVSSLGPFVHFIKWNLTVKFYFKSRLHRRLLCTHSLDSNKDASLLENIQMKIRLKRETFIFAKTLQGSFSSWRKKNTQWHSFDRLVSTLNYRQKMLESAEQKYLQMKAKWVLPSE